MDGGGGGGDEDCVEVTASFGSRQNQKLIGRLIHLSITGHLS